MEVLRNIVKHIWWLIYAGNVKEAVTRNLISKLKECRNLPPSWVKRKITTQKIKRIYKQRSKYKRRQGWTNSTKIETDCNRGFSIVHFCSLETFDLMLGRHICLMQSCDFVIYILSLKLRSEYGHVIGIVKKMNKPAVKNLLI